MSPPSTLSEIAGCLHRNELSEAERICGELLKLEPENARAWQLCGVAHARQGSLEQAVECFRQAIAFDQSNSLYEYNLGLALKSLGRVDEAMDAYRRAIAKKHDFLEARNNLGNALVEKRKNEQAISCFRELVELFPESADGHFNLANVLQDTGNIDESLSSYRRTLELSPDHSAARENLGRALVDDDRLDEAQQVWSEWLDREPDNAIARHMVASLTGENTPDRCGDEYVRETFNRDFAKNFDRQLARLDYQAPRLVSDALAGAGREFWQVDLLDAGCGTGLCGPRVRAISSRLVGIDLSGDMLDEARKRDAYDELIEIEITRYMRDQIRSFDLIISADTFCYFGDLRDLLAAAFGCLRDDGRLIFTVERSDQSEPHPHRLGEHGRYRHREDYVKQTLTETGFATIDVSHGTLRKERGIPVEGLVVIAAHPTS